MAGSAIERGVLGIAAGEYRRLVYVPTCRVDDTNDAASGAMELARMAQPWEESIHDGNGNGNTTDTDTDMVWYGMDGYGYGLWAMGYGYGSRIWHSPSGPPGNGARTGFNDEF